jgi:putative peptidoglycan lipid II flippase
VRLLYERGEFTALDTQATAAALRFYALGLLAYSVVRIVSPVFYALGRNRTPVVVSMITVLVNAGLNLVLVRVMGFEGLALGTSIAALFNASVLATLLRRHLGGLQERRILGSFARVVVAALLMGAAAAVADARLPGALPGEGLAIQTLRLSITIGLSLAVLAAASWALRLREFHEGMALVTRRFTRAR